MSISVDQSPPQTLHFAGFRLDLARAVLIGADGGDIPLRPKTFALLHYMLAHVGRVVPREELLEAIWPGVTVSDDSITQCVSEIRRALGTDSARILRTLPKRGYVFEAEITPEPAPAKGRATPAGRAGWPLMAAGTIGVLAVIAGAVWRMQQPAQPAWPPGSRWQVQLTADQTEARRLFSEADAMMLAPNQPQSRLAGRALLERAITVDPSFANAYADLALTYTNIVHDRLSPDPAADLAKAEPAADRALALAPDLGLAHLAIASVRRGQGRFAEALLSYRHAIALDPLMHSARLSIGLSQSALGQQSEAILSFREALRIGQSTTNQMEAHSGLGLAQMLASEVDLGEAEQRKALQYAPLTGLSADRRHLLLAASLALTGKTEAAREEVDRVSPDSPVRHIAWFRTNAASTEPAYLAQIETLYRGLALAGVPE